MTPSASPMSHPRTLATQWQLLSLLIRSREWALIFNYGLRSARQTIYIIILIIDFAISELSLIFQSRLEILYK